VKAHCGATDQRGAQAPRGGKTDFCFVGGSFPFKNWLWGWGGKGPDVCEVQRVTSYGVKLTWAQVLPGDPIEGHLIGQGNQGTKSFTGTSSWDMSQLGQTSSWKGPNSGVPQVARRRSNRNVRH